jgi:hypothetical protein
MCNAACQTTCKAYTLTISSNTLMDPFCLLYVERAAHFLESDLSHWAAPVLRSLYPQRAVSPGMCYKSCATTSLVDAYMTGHLHGVATFIP